LSSRKPIGNLRGNEEVAIAPRASDASYRLLFEKHPTPMWVFAAESLSFLAVNEAAINRYGYSRAEFLRMTIRDIGLEKSIPALADGVASQPAGYENSTRCTHLKKDGTRIDVEIAFESLVWFGKPAMLAMATDVTERKRTEERLNQSE
jgi:PAS domain S-box-containing protein